MIEVRQIHKTYGDIPVLKNINLQLKKHQLISLIGANGAGKSTLLGIMSRLMPSDSGEVWIDHLPISAYKTQDLATKISILKQTNSIQLRIKVSELVALGRFPHSKGRLTPVCREKINDAIAFTGLAPLKDKYLDQLSGGERQRAFIAMIIAQDTEYIFLDEPLNHLDMRHASNMMQLIRQMVDTLHKSVILVMHDVNFASTYSDELIAMHQGEIVLHGKVNDLMTQEVLEHVYAMPIQIEEVKNRKICIYY